ncbi:hypothetical protein [Nocardia sp. CA-119907]|uniref:hypothetical protein n=1 Tax=Nocardia sp. CA-119907 TaxID=3239973 RepID=UPI003D9813BA
MPIQQTVGIILAAVVAAISIPKLLEEFSARERLTRRLSSMLSVTDKLQHDGALSVISTETDQLALRLASVIAIRPSRRDWVESVVAGLAPGVWVLATSVWPFRGMLNEHHWLSTSVLAVSLVAVQQVSHTVATRLGTLHYNRQLYIKLGAPADPPLLSVPTIRDYLLRPTLTADLILRISEAAKRKTDEDGLNVPLVDHVRAAILDCEQRFYRRQPRPR